VTLKENTERPETVEVGANALAGREPGSILEKAKRMLGKGKEWSNPFGDGKASNRIVSVICSE